jgi:hypothetical protein
MVASIEKDDRSRWLVAFDLGGLQLSRLFEYGGSINLALTLLLARAIVVIVVIVFFLIRRFDLLSEMPTRHSPSRELMCVCLFFLISDSRLSVRERLV